MAAATAAGLIGGNGSSSSSWFKLKDRQRKKKMVNRVMLCSASSSVMDPYQTLRIQPNASESDVKKAFRKLALQVRF
jgi:DnaJ-class molecular chaperone